MSDVPNLQFDAQTKESISNSVGEIKAFLSDKIDFDSIQPELIEAFNKILPDKSSFEK